MLNELPDCFDRLISAVDAAHTDDGRLNFEFVQIRCLQEEQRHATRDKDSLKSAETVALMTKRRPKAGNNYSPDICEHCG